jgi:protease II
MAELCPYHNAGHAKLCPPVLVTCTVNDVRVPFWGPAKWVARLRASQKGLSPVLLLPRYDGGHFGRESDRVRDAAKEMAFLLKALCWNDVATLE